MGVVNTGIELQDNFSSVIYNIINAVNMSVCAMEDMQQIMNSDVNTSGIEGIREEINQATIAMDELNAAMQDQAVINMDTPENMSAPNPTSQPNVPSQSRAPPDPVEIPVIWNTDGLDVFTTSGIERFQQEIQSTNGMMNTLNGTQERIQQTADSIDILPDSATADIRTMGQRLAAIQARIQAIETNPVNIGTDQANAELERLRVQLNQAIQQQSNLNTAMDNLDVNAANAAYMRLSQTIGGTEQYIRDNIDEQGRFNQQIREGTDQANGLTNTIKGAVAAYVSIQSLGKVLNLSDELVQTTSRLNLMNEGLQSTDELVNMVYVAAQDARGSFGNMAAVVAKFGNNAKDAFGSSEEVVAFANLVQKQMTIAGASTAESSNAMLQLSQALGSGVLRGDELNSIFEQAPNLIQNIADYLDVPIGKIREMASEGELSADVVKAAIFSASDDINSKFESMPMTWGQIWTSMQNTMIMAFRPVLQRLNDIANSEAFQGFVDGVINAMATLANIILNVFDLVGQVGGFIADNWSIISPIIYGVITALGVYYGWLLLLKAAEMGLAAVQGAATVIKMLAVPVYAALTGSTMAETAAQWGLNAALYACPIVWIIMLVIALIAIIYAVIAAINHFAGTSLSATGMICGAFAVAGAFIWNQIIGVVNAVIGIGIELYNLIATFANFLANVFNDPVGAIINLFSGMFDFILGVVQAAAKLIDTILNTDMSSAVEGFRNDISDKTAKLIGEQTVVMEKLNASDYQLEGVNYEDAWNTGYSLGEGLEDKISDFSLSDLFGSTEMPNPEDYSSQFGDMGGSLENIAGDTGNISDAMDITAEDLKYLRDIAEQEAVNKYTVAEVNIDQSGMQNTIKNDNDIDGFMSSLTESVNEAVNSITEGVHT